MKKNFSVCFSSPPSSSPPASFPYLSPPPEKGKQYKELKKLKETREKIQKELWALQSGGGTALGPAVAAAIGQVRRREKKEREEGGEGKMGGRESLGY